MPSQDIVGVDLDASRRPGVPRFREPKPWPNARWPIPRQQGKPSASIRGKVTPVFSTALPLHGLSGAVRRFAYRRPDTHPVHWLALLLGDRVEWWSRKRKGLLLLALPLAVVAMRRLR